MMGNVRIRRYADRDASSVSEVFRRAVLEGAKEHYTRKEREAWAGPASDPRRWHDRLNTHSVFVADTSDGIIGFMTLTADGLVDHAYVLPEYRGTGVAQRLYRRIEDEARSLGLTGLRTQASHYARPFFERLGWKVTREQKVQRRGVDLTNFRMKKAL